jgi:hypothetical protein
MTRRHPPCLIHGDTISGDDMVKVGDQWHPKGALRPLHVEAMCTEGIKDEVDMLQMLEP